MTRRLRLRLAPGRPSRTWGGGQGGVHQANPNRSGKKDRRQPPSPRHRMFVGRAPRLEELNQLLAGGVVIPFTVAAHDLEQLVEGLLPTAISVQCYGKVEARLVIERVG